MNVISSPQLGILFNKLISDTMHQYWKLWVLPLMTLVFTTKGASAQIIPDNTVGTTVTSSVIKALPTTIINGGNLNGNNLFHSFQEFNIDAGKAVYFNNPDAVTRIFTRVTGNNPSNINGVLGVLGNADLFLLNPHGIVFGSGAQLDLKGSFLGTTATTIKFADGTEFNSKNPQFAPLLIVSVPVGLGFGSIPGEITVTGVGHQLTRTNATYPINRSLSSKGLQVSSGETLALVGGNLQLNGGILTAESGQIELGSVDNGIVNLKANSQGFTLDYSGVTNFQDIKLSEKALVDVSGETGGSIQLQGKQITLSNGSLLFSQNTGIQTQKSGNLVVNATDLVNIIGTTYKGTIPSGFRTQTVGGGASGDMIVSTPQLKIYDGGAIVSQTFSQANGGSIYINASKLLEVNGFDPINPGVNSFITAFTYLNQHGGKSGDIVIATKDLSILNSGSVGASTVGSGQGGNVKVDAEAINISGANIASIPSLLGSGSYGAGDAGKLIINTKTLILRDSGIVATTSISSGKAGELYLNASEFIDIAGKEKTPEATASEISSAVIIPIQYAQNLFNLSLLPSAQSGSVTINTPKLIVTNGSQVSVRNEGINSAGQLLKINADYILLNDGNISATTKSGNGGNIQLNTQNLQMRHHSNINTTAGRKGDGGNISIDAGTILQLENSNITANAPDGRGGNINITTQGLFQSPDSMIAATGSINGNINISTPDVNQENSLLEQSAKFVPTEQLVASSCLANRNSQQGKFILTGNGGVPETPLNMMDSAYEVVQVQAVDLSHKKTSATEEVNRVDIANSPQWKIGNPITEATQLLTTADGRLLLVALPVKDISSAQQLVCNQQ